MKGRGSIVGPLFFVIALACAQTNPAVPSPGPIGTEDITPANVRYLLAETPNPSSLRVEVGLDLVLGQGTTPDNRPYDHRTWTVEAEKPNTWERISFMQQNQPVVTQAIESTPERVTQSLRSRESVITGDLPALPVLDFSPALLAPTRGALPLRSIIQNGSLKVSSLPNDPSFGRRIRVLAVAANGLTSFDGVLAPDRGWITLSARVGPNRGAPSYTFRTTRLEETVDGWVPRKFELVEGNPSLGEEVSAGTTLRFLVGATVIPMRTEPTSNYQLEVTDAAPLERSVLTTGTSPFFYLGAFVAMVISTVFSLRAMRLAQR